MRSRMVVLALACFAWPSIACIRKSDCIVPSTQNQLSLVQREASLLTAPIGVFMSQENMVGSQFLVGDQVPFYLYEPSVYEPRFEGSLANCERKGADYMFLQAVRESPWRVFDDSSANIAIVPCLFETYRRCTSTNHAEKPPSLLEVKSNPHPEDFEQVPWMKAFDYDTETCLQKVVATKTWQTRNGHNHFWVVADWTLNFGKSLIEPIYQNMILGRIEVPDKIGVNLATKIQAMTQASCNVVVPYASDVAYKDAFSKETTFGDWQTRSTAVFFRFEDREYVFFCKEKPCEGAIDATPMRRQSLLLKKKLGLDSTIVMERVPLEQFKVELNNAKFCLVIRGDTPSTHALYDALAANCIPVLISDRWPVVAKPFSSGPFGQLLGSFDYESFTVVFSTNQWMNDIDGVVAKFRSILSNESITRKYFDAMQIGRRELLWSMPGNVVSRNVLIAANNCLTEPN
eukprot:TRINITY_DN50534_c0_g1_i1.p1 TRINITY_DN50534_c0_g1~~TRINITY_DN50534_c0_g1_i1.p1  ORF type:complete len:459 (-),score=76.43 TRINITY_DN50534_c0_g1_i1:83-1459(-)